MTYNDDWGPMATMSDAHREWHLNSGVPMGQPGCPQDACHPVDDYDYEDDPALVKCGNRKAHPEGAYHLGAAGVRDCYGVNGPGTQPAPHRADWAAIPVGGDTFGDYALQFGDKVRLFSVQRPIDGKWAGYTFVKEMLGKDRVRPTDYVSVLTRIAADPEAAAALYGHTTTRCFRCHRRLTQPSSVERGMGPVCASKAGW